MKQLYEHQRRFLEKNPDRALLLWEMQTGKTRAACEWLKRRPRRKALVICPKAVVEKWQRELREWYAKADVVAMSQIHKVNLGDYSALVVDEAHHFASPLFTAQRSQRATTLYNYFRAHRGAHVLLLTATPVRSTAWNIHTLGCYLGQFYPIKQFRETFFYFTDLYGRWHWEPKKDWRIKIRPFVESVADIVLMSECADVPVQHEQVVRVPWLKADEDMLTREYMEPAKEWHARHRAENGRTKFEAVMAIVNGYRKAIVVCHYREQIDNFVAWIGEERQVFILDGRTKNQDEVIEAAKKADDCIFIVQASMGAGFSAAEFSVVIFASMDFKYVSYVQMKGRVKVISNLHENTFYYLLGGKCDEAVYQTIQSGRDFDPLDYMQKRV